MGVLQKLILICLFTSAFFQPSFGQAKTELIKVIRNDFQAISHDSTLKKKTLENEEFLKNMPDGGGELTGYYKNESIVKIVEWIGLSYGNRTREFYFRRGQLFFVYEKFESFARNDTTGETDFSKSPMITFEGRYYFNNNKLIEQKTSGKRTFEDATSDIIKELQDAATSNIKLLRRKKHNQHNE
jgi:hypothetical protein